VAIETVVARLSGVGKINVSELSSGKFLNQPSIRFNPRTGPQTLLVGNRHNGYATRTFQIGPAVYGKRNLPARSPIQQSIDIVGRLQLDAVDCQDVVTDRDVGAGCRERSAQFRIPTLVIVNPGHLVTPA